MSEANLGASDEPAPITPESTSATPPPPRKSVSTTRKAISSILLVGLLAACAIQLLAVFGYNRAVAQLESIQSDKDMVSRPTQTEIETRIGKKADGPSTGDGPEKVATYTWQGLRRYSVLVYYNPVTGDRFLRYETQDATE